MSLVPQRCTQGWGPFWLTPDSKHRAGTQPSGSIFVNRPCSHVWSDAGLGCAWRRPWISCPAAGVAPAGALGTWVCSAGVGHGNCPRHVPSLVGTNLLVISQECSVMTLTFKTPSRLSCAGPGPLTLAAFCLSVHFH